MKTIGATCNLKFNNGDKVEGYYFSFGSYDEENDADSYGVPDDDIFYYCANGELEIKALTHSPKGDFEVLSYELEFSL